MEKNQIAKSLLVPLFRCISAEYKSKYMREIWEQFENRVRDSAYTSSLSKFLENMKLRIPITIENRYLDDITSVMNSGQDEEILTVLRSETVHVVLLAQVIVQEENTIRKKI